MLKQLAIGLALGFVGYKVYQAATGASITTDSGDGGLIGGIVGAVLDTGYQAASMVSGGKMQISLQGLAHIKGWEGFRSQRYLDAAGKPTIGYGHLIKPLENLDTVTEAQATALLLQDVASAEAAVNKGVRVPISQHQFDALVSFAYNVGNGAFLSSTLLKLLNAGKYGEAQKQFGRWVYVTKGGQKVKVAGLVNRRTADARLFAGQVAA